MSMSTTRFSSKIRSELREKVSRYRAVCAKRKEEAPLFCQAHCSVVTPGQERAGLRCKIEMQEMTSFLFSRLGLDLVIVC